jgi:transposase InsO family protein
MRHPEALERAVRLVAENRIREAAEAGAFDRLPGAGRPLPDLDEPYDELWWVRRWLRRERLHGELREELRRSLRRAGRASGNAAAGPAGE